MQETVDVSIHGLGTKKPKYLFWQHGPVKKDLLLLCTINTSEPRTWTRNADMGGWNHT